MREVTPGATDWRRLAPIAALLFFGVCANGPPPEGTEGTIGAGRGAYSIVACGTRYEYHETVVHAGFRNGERTGWSQSIDISRYEEVLVDKNVFDEPGDAGVSADEPHYEVGGVLAARVGYHGEHVGGEFGPAIAHWTSTNDMGAIPLPSGNLWAGTRNVYGWVTLLDGAFSQGQPGINVGIGSQLAHGGMLRLGYGLGGPLAETSVPVRENLRLGAEACFESSSDWRVVGRLTFVAPQRKQPRAAPTPEPQHAPSVESTLEVEVTPVVVVDTALVPAIVGTAGP